LTSVLTVATMLPCRGCRGYPLAVPKVPAGPMLSNKEILGPGRPARGHLAYPWKGGAPGMSAAARSDDPSQATTGSFRCTRRSSSLDRICCRPTPSIQMGRPRFQGHPIITCCFPRSGIPLRMTRAFISPAVMTASCGTSCPGLQCSRLARSGPSTVVSYLPTPT